MPGGDCARLKNEGEKKIMKPTSTYLWVSSYRLESDSQGESTLLLDPTEIEE